MRVERKDAGGGVRENGEKGGSERDTVPKQCLCGFPQGEAVTRQCLRAFRGGSSQCAGEPAEFEVQLSAIERE